jgi:hypothetical protein
MENKLLKNSLKGYFIAVAILMYYFLNETINLGLFITYRHAFALVLFASALICFLIKPNIARGSATLKPTLVYCIPLIITVVVSLFIWFMEQVDTAVIARGLSGAFIYNNMLSFTLAAAAFLYIFGEKGIWYNLIAILASNILIIFTVILQNGIDEPRLCVHFFTQRHFVQGSSHVVFSPKRKCADDLFFFDRGGFCHLPINPFLFFVSRGKMPCFSLQKKL